MASSSWDWPEFQQDIHGLLRLSARLGDSWQLVSNPNIQSTTEECSEYLRRKSKFLVNLPPSAQDEPRFEDHHHVEDPSSASLPPSFATLLVYEFHVLFHPSYRVPSLFFNATKPNGSHLTLDEAWQLLTTNAGIRSNLAAVITEMHHPVLVTPFLALHPCRTAELLDALPLSKNRVLTFLSTLGPAVNLEMDVRYGIE